VADDWAHVFDEGQESAFIKRVYEGDRTCRAAGNLEGS
jgi:hypothetical protein